MVKSTRFAEFKLSEYYMSFESGLSKFGKFLDGIQKRTALWIKDLFLEKRSRSTARKGPHASSSHYVILLFDSFVAFLSIFISIHLRIGMDFLDYSPLYIAKNMLVFGLVSSSVFLWFQTYQSFWRYTSVEDIMPIFLSVIISNILYFPLMMLMNQEDFLPYSVLVINMFVLCLMLLIPRFVSRILYNNKMNQAKRIESLRCSGRNTDVPPVLLIGSLESVEAFLREVSANYDEPFNFNPVGILSIDSEDVGRTIKGVPILGTITQISAAMKELSRKGIHPKQLFVTDKTIPDNSKKFLITYVQDRGIMLMHVLHQYSFNTVTE